jgi:hypothetical protein
MDARVPSELFLFQNESCIFVGALHENYQTRQDQSKTDRIT